MKLCKDCKHFKGHMGITECTAPGNMQPDFVNGGAIVRQNLAQILRMTECYCGPEAKWFEERAQVAA